MKSSVVVLIAQWVLLVSVVVASSVPRLDLAEVKLFEEPAAYDVETTLFLNDVARTDREVSYKVKGRLTVQPVWRDQDKEFLLKLQLVNPRLYLRGKHPNANFLAHRSIWDMHNDSPFYVHWKNGLIENTYLNLKELPDFINYKKSLISLFQFQIIDGEYNETDISGPCDILYESLSKDVFRKIKRGCAVDAALSAGRARRLARYTLSGGALGGVHAEELVELGGAEAGLKARAWHRLAAAPPLPPPATSASSLEAALAELPDYLTTADLAFVETKTVDDDVSLEDAIHSHRDALQVESAGAGGDIAHARAALQLLPTLRAASAHQLTKLLEEPDNYPLLVGLCRLLGLAGTRAAHAAVDALTHLTAREPLQPHAREYLAAAALARDPSPQWAGDLAALADAAKDPAVSAAARVAAAAAARKLPPPAADNMRDALAKGLAKCKEDACRVAVLGGLGALAHPLSCELLLQHAEKGTRATALAALDALHALYRAHPSELHYARRLRLEKIAASAGRALELRAAALDLVMVSSVGRPATLAGVLGALANGPRELRRLYWARLGQLAADHEQVAEVIPMLPPHLATWNERALAGTSSVLVRSTGWGAGGWRARLQSVQVAADGLLRRGAVTLHAHAPQDAHELVAVEVWTRGLQALAGTGAQPDPNLYEGDEESEQEVAGGLALGVGGVRLPGVKLFDGQAELLSQVWAGAGSEPTPALRAVLPHPESVRASMPLLAGVTLHYHYDAALAVALDAHATVSLWSRSARSGLELRLGALEETILRVRAAWGTMDARATAHAEPRLRIDADLDFYTDVALCVRAHTTSHILHRESELQSMQGMRRLKVVRRRNATSAVPPRTLRLTPDNDRACNALPNAD